MTDVEQEIERILREHAGDIDDDLDLGQDEDDEPDEGYVPYEAHLEMSGNSDVDGRQPAPERDPRFRDGGSFIFDAPNRIPAIWGAGDEVGWAPGESLMLVGPPGVIKSTTMQHLVLGRLGLADEVLGYPVTPGERNVLYLASDRPPQISRSFRRMVSADDRQLLSERLVVWEGPPPADFAKHPGLMLDMCRKADADTLAIDSLKDVALSLHDPEVGAAYNNARQRVLVEGVDVVEAHHQTKRGAGGIGKPNTLADVYGSTWLTAGAGSVILLWGKAGDPIINLSHLKPPAGEFGPFKVIHDAQTGAIDVWHAADLLQTARASLNGITAKTAACALFSTDKPDPAEVEKARRRLESMTKKGTLERFDGDTAAGKPTLYYPAGRLPIGGLE